jgi:hypothetical protein
MSLSSPTPQRGWLWWQAGRPATPRGDHGTISNTRLESGKYRAFARYRRWDGRLSTVTATGASKPAARRLLEERIVSQLR